MPERFSKISSPLEITLEWTRTLPEPEAVLSLAAFELKKRSDKVESYESIAFLGSSIDVDGKAATKDGGIRLGVLDVTDNMAPTGRCTMTIALDKVSSDKIKLAVFSIPKKKGKKLFFKDCVSAKVTIKDASGQRCTFNVVNAVVDTNSMALSFGILRGGRNWSYKEEVQLYDGGIEKLLEALADKKIYSQHPYTQESIHKDLHKRITVFYAEALERARKEEEANKARRAAEEARRQAEARRKFEEEKARLAAKEEARRKAEEEARKKAEEEERLRIEAEKERQRAEEEAIRKAAEEATRLQAEAEKKARIAKDEAKAKAEAEAMAKVAAEEAKKAAEEAAEDESIRKEEESKTEAKTPDPIISHTGSKRWKHQVTKMHGSSDPVGVAQPDDSNAIPANQLERKPKAWKNARSVRHEEVSTDDSSKSETVIPEQIIDTNPLATATKNLGSGKKWKGQVPKRQEQSASETPIIEAPVISAEQTSQNTRTNTKRRFPKINR